MAKARPVFDHFACIGCGKCVRFCPVESLTLTKTYPDIPNRAFPEQTGRACLGCGLCAKQCPAHAIEMTAGVPY